MSDLNKLKQLLVSKGIAQSFVDTAEIEVIKGVAKAFKIDPAPYLPRDVRLERGKTGALYVVTSGYAVPKYRNGKPTGEMGLARNLYVRADALDDMIEDFLYAKGLVEEHDG